MVFGSILDGEGSILSALVKMLNPQTIVEFGFGEGAATQKLLAFMDKSAKLYSYDIANHSTDCAAKIKSAKFKFIHEEQQSFTFEQIDKRYIDLCFMDASHDWSLNVKTFELIKDYFNRDAILVVHDTGTWARQFSLKESKDEYWIRSATSYGVGHYVTQNEYSSLPAERRFINYIDKHYKGFNIINLHTQSAFRHGLTLIQKGRTLEVDKWTP